MTQDNTALSPLFNVMDEVGITILKNAKTVHFPANTTLYRSGDQCHNYLLLTQGKVKVFTRGENGREIVLYRIASGDSCVLTTSCLMGHNNYTAEAVSETDISALMISTSQFNLGIAESERFREFIFESFGQRLGELIHLIESVTFQSIDVRIARYIIQHANDEGKINITHQTLALEIGSAREVVSRHLKEMERNQVLHLQRGSIEIKNTSSIEALSKN